MNIFDKYRQGVSKTKKNFFNSFLSTITGKHTLDAEMVEDIEAVLLGADVGHEVVESVLQSVRKANDGKREIETLFKNALADILHTDTRVLHTPSEKPAVYLFVGVNGVGKTTTIAKLATMLKEQGKKVLIGAGDTYRAAGIDQMKLWGERLGVRVIGHERGGDAAAVVYDVIDAGVSQQYDTVVIDTAGRLHTKENLMKELEKVRRTLVKKLGREADETILVCDATSGQNVLRQAEEFHKTAGLTGFALTKMDGTAKGGLVFSLEKKFGLPVKLIGLGEGQNDLEVFDPEMFLHALFEIRE